MIDWRQFNTEAEAIAYLKTAKDITCATTTQAKQYIRKNLPKESYYQTKIIKRIRELVPLAFVWKAAAGAYGRKGIPDICAIINGEYYGFEVKRPLLGVVSEIQKKTIEQIKDAGGRAYIVTYEDEIDRILRPEIEAATPMKPKKTIIRGQESYYCPACHSEIGLIPDRFCPYCGQRLKLTYGPEARDD